MKRDQTTNNSARRRCFSCEGLRRRPFRDDLLPRLPAGTRAKLPPRRLRQDPGNFRKEAQLLRAAVQVPQRAEEARRDAARLHGEGPHGGRRLQGLEGLAHTTDERQVGVHAGRAWRRKEKRKHGALGRAKGVAVCEAETQRRDGGDQTVVSEPDETLVAARHTPHEEAVVRVVWL